MIQSLEHRVLMLFLVDTVISIMGFSMILASNVISGPLRPVVVMVPGLGACIIILRKSTASTIATYAAFQFDV